jgi:hypothetical protein
MARKFVACHIAYLPEGEQVEAAQRAILANPVNKLAMMPSDPAHLAGYTTKFWRADEANNLTVQFLDNPGQAWTALAMEMLNRWRTVAKANVQFRHVTRDGVIRVTAGNSGHWSNLGRDALMIGRNQPTMNLQLTTRTPRAEWVRVATHEAGHALGFVHEQLRPEIVSDLLVTETIAYFRRTQGWDEQTTRSNVLTPLDPRGLVASELTDRLSLMCYSLPAAITKSRKPVEGGSDFTATDIQTGQRIYPGLAPTDPPPPPPPAPTGFAFGAKLIETANEKQVHVTVPAGYRVYQTNPSAAPRAASPLTEI